MATATDKISVFIKLYFPAAVKCWRDTDIPVLFTLAQAGLESDWGNKAKSFNFFGITPGSTWKGKTQLLPTVEDFPDNDRKKHVFPDVTSIIPYKTLKGEQRYLWHVKRLFRAYDSAADGFSDHAEVLKLPRYAAAFKEADPKKFAMAIAAAGYATGQGYGKLLGDCIDSVKKRLPLLGLQLP